MIKKLRYITEDREKMGLSDLSQFEGVKQSVSTGKLIASTQSQVKGLLPEYRTLGPDLKKNWYLKDLHSAEHQNVEIVDINEMLSGYTEKQIKELILPNIYYFPLTVGCNGECYFCVGSPQIGVKKRFSLSSIKTFLEKYKDELEYGKPFTLGLFYDEQSDPFDYNVGEDNILELLKFVTKNYTHQSLYLSTVIPKGSQKLFIQTLLWLLKEYLSGYQNHRIRISVGPHNIQRLETVLIQFYEIVDGLGIENSDEQLDDFFEKQVFFAGRFREDIEFLGKTIKKHDDYKSAWSPSCADGIKLSPEGVSYRYMTAANKYYPGGYYEAQGLPREGFKHVHIEDAPMFHNDFDGELLSTLSDSLENTNPEDLVIILSRELRILDSILDYYDIRNDIHGKGVDVINQKFLPFVNRVYKEYSDTLRPRIITLINKGLKAISEVGIDSHVSDNITYQINILRFSIKKLDFLLELKETVNSAQHLYFACFIKCFGEDQVESFEEIIKIANSSIDLSEYEDNDASIIELSKRLYFHLGHYFPNDNHVEFEKITQLEHFYDYAPHWLFFATLNCINKLCEQEEE